MCSRSSPNCPPTGVLLYPNLFIYLFIYLFIIEVLVDLQRVTAVIIRCKLVYTGWINNKVLLYSTGNYIQYPVINHNGKEYEKECIYIYV